MNMNKYALPKGTELNDRYIIEEVIGSGGFGITYAAYDLLLNSMVAIKEFLVDGYMQRSEEDHRAVLLPSASEQMELVEKSRNNFLREISIMKEIQNVPYISRIRDDFYANGTNYIVMSLLKGKSLSDFMKESNGIIKASKLMKPMEHVLEALAEMHSLGYIHRDISPGNLFLTDGGDLYLIDFGTASCVALDSELHSREFFEHKGFQAPEYKEVDKQGPWTDIYSLCATLVYLLTGEGIPNPEDRALYDDVPRLILKRGLTNRQQNALLKGLKTDIASRWNNAQELKNELCGDLSVDYCGKEIRYSASTHIGSRKINQDNLIVDGQFYFEGRDFTKSGLICSQPDEIHLVAVCDGVGGASFGELASRAAVQALNHFLRQYRNSEILPERLIPELLDQMNEKIISLSKKIGQTGTTLSLLLWKGNQYYAVNVGDSPIFLLRKRKLQQISVSHTLATTKEMAGIEIYMQDRHTLVNYLGRKAIAGSQMMAYSHGYIEKGDTYLLCSDGISNKIDKDTLKRLLRKNEKAAMQSFERIINRCTDNDNCTAIVLKF